jgi:hypothetical protein
MPEFAEELPRTRSAIAYARRMHEGQRREVDGAPFVEHPLEVASLHYCAGAPDHVIAAGVLHDTLEKTAATEQALAARFGPEIAAIVGAVTEDERFTAYGERKEALRDHVEMAGQDALMAHAHGLLPCVQLRTVPCSTRSPRLTARGRAAGREHRRHRQRSPAHGGRPDWGPNATCFYGS